jgi:hypothetical protein
MMTLLALLQNLLLSILFYLLLCLRDGVFINWMSRMHFFTVF